MRCSRCNSLILHSNPVGGKQGAVKVICGECGEIFIHYAPIVSKLTHKDKEDE